VIAGDLVFLAGQVATDLSADTEAQAAEVLRAIDALLEKAGTDKRRLVSVNVYLSDISNFAAMNKSWDAWLDPDHKPARATFESKLARPEFKVEMVAIAALP